MNVEKDQITVLYRDDRLIFVDKPSGMVVHRGWANDPVTLSDIVRDQIIGDRVFALFRLDRGTSGVSGFALDSEMAKLIQELIVSGSFQKEYLALVRGPLDDPVHVNHPVPRSPGGEKVEAETNFFPLKRAGRWTLVRAIPKTGRLHQIRKHLKHLSLPIIGDTKYGKGDVNRYFREEFNLNRLALHARILKFSHPLTGQELELESTLPDELADVFEALFS